MESSQPKEGSNQLLRVAEVLAARVHVENEVDAAVVLPNESVGSFVKRLWNEKRKIRRAEHAARLVRKASAKGKLADVRIKLNKRKI